MRLSLVLLLLAVSLSLNACGRKATPQPPPDGIYPMHYPTGRQPGDNWVLPRDDFEVATPDAKGGTP